MKSETKYALSFASVLQPFVERRELAGAVVLSANGHEVLSLDSVGSADIAGGRPMRDDALFWIASTSKPITGAAFMMLVDEGKVRIDDPVSDYLPEFTGQWLQVEKDEEHELLRQPAHPITVRNILTHTSGLPFCSAMETPTLDTLPLRAAVRSYAMSALVFPPDSLYQYSNAGINIAGRIIEVVSGMAYEDFLEQRLFAPLGMTDTTFWPNAEQLSRLAKSYRPAADGGLEEAPLSQLKHPLDDRLTRYPMPAGGLFSTASDLAPFCQMVLNGGVWQGTRYLSEAAVREMTSKQTGAAVPTGYGYGWSCGENGVFGHGGAHANDMSIDAPHDLITIYMVQHSGGFPGEGGTSNAAFKQAVLASVTSNQ